PLAQEVAADLLRAGIVVNAIGPDILRFLPPLVCGPAEIATLVGALESTLSDLVEGGVRA
ncbi:MAG TPA: acetylornithine transaminase, partial [Coriobacteriia bacterium]